MLSRTSESSQSWGRYLTSGLWVMSVPLREKGWHHSRVIIVSGWAPIESSHYAPRGPTFWKPRDLLVLCRLHPTGKCIMHAICGCVRYQLARADCNTTPVEGAGFSRTWLTLTLSWAQIISNEEVPVWQMMQAWACHWWALFRREKSTRFKETVPLHISHWGTN